MLTTNRFLIHIVKACLGTILVVIRRRELFCWYGFDQVVGKTAASVSAVFKELAQHPPHTLFDMWNLFFDHPKCFLGTLSPRVVVHNFSTACYTRYLPKI